MPDTKQAVKTLIKKLEFNPVPLGGRSIFTTPLGIVLGAIVMIIVAIYAFGKFAYLEDDRNVVTNTYEYQNDPYEVDLRDWELKASVYEGTSGRYVDVGNMHELGLNVTVYNRYGEDLVKSNPSSLIQHPSQPNMMTIDTGKTPFVVAGSNYVHESPAIKEFLMEFQYCDVGASPLCRDGKPRKYFVVLFLKPKWAYLGNPKQPGIKEMNFNEKITIDPAKPTIKYQLTYDVYGFNVTSDASLLPAFFPRTLSQESGSSIAGPATKIYLPQDSKNLIEFHFRRSEHSESHTRKFNSIDAIFAQILGIIALFGLILWVAFAHYTTWGSEEFILKSITGQPKKINLFRYLKFHLTCQTRTKKQQKILSEVHQNIIDSYKQRKRRKIEIEILKLRTSRLQSAFNMQNNQNQCKKIVLERVEEQERNQLFSSTILTEEIRTSLLTANQ